MSTEPKLKQNESIEKTMCTREWTRKEKLSSLRDSHGWLVSGDPYIRGLGADVGFGNEDVVSCPMAVI